MGNLTRKDLATSLAHAHDVPVTEAERYVDSVFAALVAGLKGGQGLEIRGFGSLKAVDKPARKGCNPKTGESITIAARKGVKFKASKALLETIQ